MNHFWHNVKSWNIKACEWRSVVSRISSFDSFSVLLSLPTHLYNILYTTSSITTLTNTNSNCKRINARCHHAQIQNHSRSGAFPSTVDSKLPRSSSKWCPDGENSIPADRDLGRDPSCSEWLDCCISGEGAMLLARSDRPCPNDPKELTFLRSLFFLVGVHVGVCCLCLRREDEALILGSLLLDSYHVSHWNGRPTPKYHLGIWQGEIGFGSFGASIVH